MTIFTAEMNPSNRDYLLQTSALGIVDWLEVSSRLKLGQKYSFWQFKIGQVIPFQP